MIDNRGTQSLANKLLIELMKRLKPQIRSEVGSMFAGILTPEGTGISGESVDFSSHTGAADPHTQYQKESEKGAANGYASLGADSLVPQNQLGTGTQDGTKFLRDDGTWQAAGGGAGAWTQIAEQILGVPGSFSFTSIPGTYRHLKLILVGRGDTASVAVGIMLRINNDSGANYSYQIMDSASNNVQTDSGNIAQTDFRTGSVAAASAPANYAGMVEVTIYDYARTIFNKHLFSTQGRVTGTANTDLSTRQTAGMWNSTAALSRVDLIAATGDFIAGSVCTLWGLS